MTKLIGRLALLPLLLLLSACPGSGSFDFASLGIHTTDATGAATELGCVRLPTLLGSRTRSELEGPLGLRVVVDATSEQAEVQFQGFGSSPPRLITADSLRSGYTTSETLVSNGASLDVHLSGGCARSE